MQTTPKQKFVSNKVVKKAPATVIGEKQLANMEKRIVESIAKTAAKDVKKVATATTSCRYGNACNNSACAFAHPSVKAASGVVKVPRANAAVGDYVPSSTHAVSDYLKIVFDPRSSIVADIPDSVMLAHTNFDTVTAVNIVVEPDTEEGMFIMYPADQTNLIAYYYVKKSTGGNAGKYVFVRTVRTSQNLSESYDSGRKICSLTQISSTTIGAGAFQLSGTLSALKIVGTLSELPELDYETLIGRTAGNIDKVANVPITIGVTTLSLFETFDAPYTRMDDVPPFESTAEGTTAFIHDKSQSLSYSVQVPKTDFDYGDFDLSLTVNVDCHTSLTLDGTWLLTSTNTSANESESAYLVVLQVEFYDPFGNRISPTEGNVSMLVYSNSMYSGVLKYMPDTTGVVALQLTNPAFHDKYGPVSAVRLKMIGRPDNSNANPNQPYRACLQYARFNLDVAKGQRTGSENSVEVVCYSNASAGSTITLTNYTKFELIPNPQIRETVPAAFIRQGTIIPGMADFVKAIMSRANELDLRYVYNTADYEKLLPAYMAIAEGKSPMIAKAGLLDIFKPLLGQLPIIGPLLANAATGKLRARAATSSLRLRKIVKAKATPRVAVENVPQVVAYGIDRGNITTTSMAVFPTILQDVGTKLPVQGGFYAVFPGDHSSFLQEQSHVLCNGHKIHGVVDTKVNVPIKHDCTLLPVVFTSRGWTIANGPLVEENSFNVALYLVAVMQYPGLFPYIVTGETHGEQVVQMAMDTFRYKQEECRKVGFELVGNSPLAGEFRVENMKQVRDMKLVSLAKTHTYHHSKAKAGGDDGAQLIEQFLTEQELEKMIVYALNQGGARTVAELHQHLAPDLEYGVFKRIANRFLYNNPGFQMLEMAQGPPRFATEVRDLLDFAAQQPEKVKNLGGRVLSVHTGEYKFPYERNTESVIKITPTNQRQNRDIQPNTTHAARDDELRKKAAQISMSMMHQASKPSNPAQDAYFQRYAKEEAERQRLQLEKAKREREAEAAELRSHAVAVGRILDGVQTHVPLAEKVAADALTEMSRPRVQLFRFDQVAGENEQRCRLSVLSRSNELQHISANESAAQREERDAWRKAMENMSELLKQGEYRSKASTGVAQLIDSMDTKSYRMRRPMSVAVQAFSNTTVPQPDFTELMFHQQYVRFPDDTALSQPGDVLYDSGTVCIIRATADTFVLYVADTCERSAAFAVQLVISNWCGEKVTRTLARTRLIVNGWTRFPENAIMAGKNAFVYYILAPDHHMMTIGSAVALQNERANNNLDAQVRKGCQHCGADDAKKQCSICGEKFCGRDCQVAGWQQHKAHCQPRSAW